MDVVTSSRASELTREDVIDAADRAGERAGLFRIEHAGPGPALRRGHDDAVPAREHQGGPAGGADRPGAGGARVAGAGRAHLAGTRSPRCSGRSTTCCSDTRTSSRSRPGSTWPAQPPTGGAEVVLDALRRAGIEGEAAASAFATRFAFTLGFTQQQLQSSDPGAGLAHRRAVLERLPVDDFENLSRLGGVFLLRHSDRHFDDGLDLIIGGLARRPRTEGRERGGHDHDVNPSGSIVDGHHRPGMVE